MHAFYEKYKHALISIIFMIIYFSWFFFLEQEVTNYHVIYMPIDDSIPFLELFVIPYFLWFAYVILTVLFFFLNDKKDYYKVCAFLYIGMTIFLIISTVFPNGHHLRPLSFARENVLTKMVAHLYSLDTSTNLIPSLHVYNSIGAHLAIVKSKHFKNKKGIRTASFLLSTSIILSTVFIKQHSMFDVLTAYGLAFVMYMLIYKPGYASSYFKGFIQKKL